MTRSKIAKFGETHVESTKEFRKLVAASHRLRYRSSSHPGADNCERRPDAGKKPYDQGTLLRVVQLNALPTSEVVEKINSAASIFR